MIDADRILANLYVGTSPQGVHDIRLLKDRLGITAVLNLQTDEDLHQRGVEWPHMERLYRSTGIEVHRVPMRDFDPEDQRRRLPDAVSLLSRLITCGQVVYLHCNAGVGRSPLVAMAYLCWCRHLSPEKAIRHVQQRRYCYPYVDLVREHPRDLSSSK